MGLKHYGKFNGFGKRKEPQKKETQEVNITEINESESAVEENTREEEVEASSENENESTAEEEAQPLKEDYEPTVLEETELNNSSDEELEKKKKIEIEIGEERVVTPEKNEEKDEAGTKKIEETQTSYMENDRNEKPKENIVRIHRENTVQSNETPRVKEERRPGQQRQAPVIIETTTKCTEEGEKSRNSFMDLLSLAVRVSSCEDEKKFIEEAINNRITQMLSEGSFSFGHNSENDYFVGRMGTVTVKSKGQMVLEQCARIDGCNTVAEFIENAVRDMVKDELLNVIDADIIYSSKIYEKL